MVEGALLEAKRQGINFRVVVVDSRPMLEGELTDPCAALILFCLTPLTGRNLLINLNHHQIPTTYVLLSALGSLLTSVDLVLLGTHALLSDGAMYARAGTATVAMMAKAAGKAVVCCCETYKFSDRIMLDSIGGNEVWPEAGTFPLLKTKSEGLNLMLNDSLPLCSLTRI